MGSQLGVILAAVVMVLLQEMRGFNEYRMLIFGLTMIVDDDLASPGDCCRCNARTWS
ncbi:leucine/isoleucine/valine transporter permease subunit [Pseudomonas aeruginosa]|nr:leucine/isoleucine/valine transporter permease subunit [Pseudomonas aeruginosa]